MYMQNTFGTHDCWVRHAPRFTPFTLRFTHRAVNAHTALFDHLEIYAGSKLTHFRRLAQTTDIPHSEMIFFDDEYRNAEVERHLGVEFVLVERGLTLESFRQGVQSWRRRQASGGM